MKIVHIFDIDKTLADNTHREDVLKKICVVCGHKQKFNHLHVPCEVCGAVSMNHDQSSWDEFFDAQLMMKDKPYPKAQAYVRRLLAEKVPIHFITGRGEDTRTTTENWLEMHYGIDFLRSKLKMRPVKMNGDLASKVKERSIKSLIEEENLHKDKLFIYDDDPYVFEMYKKYGIVFKAPDCWKVIDPDIVLKTSESSWRP